MARRPHLNLRRLEGVLERRKHGFGISPQRDNVLHGGKLTAELHAIVATNAQRADHAEDPTIIFKINTAGLISEDNLADIDMGLLLQTDSEAMVVYSPDPKLSALAEKARRYSGPIPMGQKGAQYAGLLDAINGFVERAPEDRIGSALRRYGMVSLDLIPIEVEFLLDVDLWDLEDGLHELYLSRLNITVTEHGGEVSGRYRGAGLFTARVKVPGAGLQAILGMREVESADLASKADLSPAVVSKFTLQTIPPIDPPPENSPCIGIIDSGLASAHPMLEGIVTGSFGVPERLGDDDEKGHGTSVAALAAFGSIAEQIDQPRIAARFRIASAKVVDAAGQFASEQTMAATIDEAVRRLHAQFGCRVINISLADLEHIVGRRPSNWAMILDNLVHELNIIVTISAGNIADPSLRLANEGLGIYPEYMLDDEHRLFEPASSVNSIVVGSLSHSNGLTPADEGSPDVVALTQMHEPSPFSRCGPGYLDAIKPDMVEYGGTAVWLGINSRLTADRPSCGVLTLNENYTTDLLGYRSGTSFAAPVAAYKAATLIDTFPGCSANFVRALMALSSDHPDPLRAMPTGKHNYLRYAGYGVPLLSLALDSEDSRVISVVEDSLPVDRFAVYEIPIPAIFQTTKGRRHIRVSLAFDPPVRNSRKEYMGVKMGFHLVRGKTADNVFDHFKKWEKAEQVEGSDPTTFEGKSWKCPMERKRCRAATFRSCA